MRLTFLVLVVAGGALASMPLAAAECVPGLDPDYCEPPVHPGPIVQAVRNAVDRVEGIVDDLTFDECYWTEHGIVCE